MPFSILEYMWLLCPYIFIAEKVDKGESKFRFYMGAMELLDTTVDLCALKPDWNITCPLLPGDALLLLPIINSYYYYTCRVVYNYKTKCKL